MTRFFKFPALIVGAALSLSACVKTTDVARDAAAADVPPSFAATLSTSEADGAPDPRDWTVRQVMVTVPETLTVSEANGYKPNADIVWREDPVGDRHAQVQAIMQEALEPPLDQLDGGTPVLVSLTVTRFHALTERTRYTFGGEHEIEFDFAVFDAASGVALTEPRHVDLTFRAYGGQEAINAEAQGIFQRDRIQARLDAWAREEFGLVTTDADGTLLTN